MSIKMERMKKIYAIFEGDKIIRMSENKDELVDYRNSFPDEVRKRIFLAERFIKGRREHQQSHWMFED